MCGIAGYYGRFESERLRRMTQAIAHRGPDGEGHDWRPGLQEGEAVGIGHRRLAIIDLAGGIQPMWSEDARIGITFNGEIYNYRELKAELIAEGGRFRTNSDTEVILEGWRLRGEEIFEALSGMFAFGIWDGRTNEWILCRDRAGIKPLYYAQPASRVLAFASEVKPLLPLVGGVRPNRQAMYEFLLYSWIPGPQTLFDGVLSLPPGTWLRWRPDAPMPKPLPYVTGRDTVSVPATFAEAAAELRGLLDAAVKSHLVADVPVGINLSGGLDSSAVLASMIREVDPGAIDAFTIGFGLPDDELPFARTVAEHAGVRHHTALASPSRIEEDFSRIIRTLEEPIGHPVLQTTFEVARLARSHVKVTMIGEGADELFLGYPQFKLMVPPYSFAPRRLQQQTFMAVACLMPTARQLSGLLNPDLLDHDAFQAASHRFDGYFSDPGGPQGVAAFEFDYPLVSNQLMRIDKLTMAHSLEARVPFLDNRLAAWSKRLPTAWKRSSNATKIILREAVADRLPGSIVHRPKTGRRGTQALLPYLNSVVMQGPLADHVAPRTVARRGLLRSDMVQAYLAAQSDFAIRLHPIESRRRAKFRYALAVLEQWSREFLDSPFP
ncbi:asparagine synthase (glutamine-hydrolyzing) [Bosea sp. TND4EK4]|uniref:asparagine synthase (glutamine-hydrolyzing) n=1 Tax=Bosea sp. TND4EK4 TaxID=1907408 RepID=UPI000956BA8F|nr:asparagine synthase (glutamine-hydrolyzing) [Bosea sp. TND4EK4]SIR41319.1 asparagine synthase (glutamine-hydrolysing) [Bosea sp. TND4EK4]